MTGDRIDTLLAIIDRALDDDRPARPARPPDGYAQRVRLNRVVR